MVEIQVDEISNRLLLIRNNNYCPFVGNHRVRKDRYSFGQDEGIFFQFILAGYA
jgi:hypothetical protein